MEYFKLLLLYSFIELVDLSRGANVVDVGLWEPMQGLMHKDHLFPHVTGGLRGRTLTVSSINVSFRLFNNKRFYACGNDLANMKSY